MLNLLASDPFERAVSPYLEMGAYEAMWLEKGTGFKKIADKFRAAPDASPSDLVSAHEATVRAEEVHALFGAAGIGQYGVRVRGAGEYPRKLEDADHPVELLYYRGAWDLTETPSVAVVGSRAASDEALRRTKRLTTELVEAGYTIVSGLADGVDSAAHHAALEAGGRTVAVTGTPLHRVYPKKNAELQHRIAADHLVVSQVPALRYDRGNPRVNSFFFPERNRTMSALTAATIIVEASDTSGTLHQARAALKQGRALFVLNSCFERADIDWPARFEKKGAMRVRETTDILKVLGCHSPPESSGG